MRPKPGEMPKSSAGVWRSACTGLGVGISAIPGKDGGMRKIVAPLLLLLLAVVHAPRQAQALVSSFFPDIFPLATSEPVMLLLTGLALISLASVGSNRPR
jgi:hypothetical protein